LLKKKKKRGEIRLKKWRCIQLNHHKKVADAIKEHRRDGWILHTYNAVGQSGGAMHYLLFEKK